MTDSADRRGRISISTRVHLLLILVQPRFTAGLKRTILELGGSQGSAENFLNASPAGWKPAGLAGTIYAGEGEQRNTAKYTLLC